MRGIINGLLLSAVLWCGGCMAYKQAYVAVHDAIDEALADQPAKTNAPTSMPTPEPVKPPADQPAASVACGCDLSKPVAIPLVPYLGKTDKEVDARLYADWKAGIANDCGGLPGDIRPQLIRPAGKAFSYKHVILSGGVRVKVNGSKITVTCGEYKGQSFHIIGGSDHEAPSNGAHPSTLPDWQPITPGQECVKKHFIYLEARDK